MSSVYDPNSPQYAPSGNTPPYTRSENSPQYAPSGNTPNSMSSDYSVPPPPQSLPGTSTSSDNSDIQVNDISELENIGKMLEKTKTKRDDGIELIINTDEPGDDKKKEDDDSGDGDNSEEKKIVKFN
jgi:hypothetical protein